MRVAWIRFFKGRPVTDEVEPEAGPLAFRPYRRVGQPDRRHELAAGQLGEDPGVDLVGLGGKGGEALDLLGIGDLDVPAEKLELVVDEAGPVHRLDRRADRLAVAIHPGHERPQRVGIGADGGHLDRSTVLIEQVHIEPLARQVQSGVQHVWASW
jgi:hypothetical protein